MRPAAAPDGATAGGADSPRLARLDLERQRRLGMVEAVWGEHKTPEQLAVILQELRRSGQLALATRVDAAKAEAVRSRLQQVEGLTHHTRARCLTLGEPAAQRRDLGRVIVLSGGTSDLPVAEEAQLALRWHGIDTQLIIDVGVAGLQRLLDQLDRLRSARVLIACAGMEGALPARSAGLLPQPVIGVPVSVGYGVSAGGLAALNGMLASCAPGLTVVNIDNGYGAAMAALRILSSGGAAGP